MREQYFAGATLSSLSNDQSRMVVELRDCLESVKPENLEPSGTRATLDASGSLGLVMTHRHNPDVEVIVTIDRQGEVEITSASLHPTFMLRYNLFWEPEDSQGDLGDALDVICGLIKGRLESEILWGGDVIARSRDVLVNPNGERRLLYTQYHADGLLGAILSRRREVRQVGFGGSE